MCIRDSPHTIECSKNASVNFYNLRKAKKKAKETLEKNTYNFRHGYKAEGRKPVSYTHLDVYKRQT